MIFGEEGFIYYSEAVKAKWKRTHDWSVRKGWPIIFLCFLGLFAVDKSLAKINVEAIQKAAFLSSKGFSESFDVLWIENFPGWYTAISLLVTGVGVIAILRLGFVLYTSSQTLGGFPVRVFAGPVAVLFFINAGLLPTTAKAIRDALMEFNDEALQVIALADKFDQAQSYASYPAALSPQIKQCEGLPPGEEQGLCFNVAAEIGSEMIKADKERFPDNPKWLKEREETVTKIGSIAGGTVTDLKTTDAQLFAQGVLDGIGEVLWTIVDAAITGWMKAIANGVFLGLEIAMILTALASPIAVYLSLSDLGMKPIYGVLIGMASLGQMGFWLNVVIGIASTGFVNGGGIVQVGFYIFMGIFSPLIALALAAGGGFALWTMLLQILSFASAGIAKPKRRNAAT